MSNLRERMINDMQLHGCGERTQKAYARIVRQLQEFYRTSPQINSEDILGTATTSASGRPAP